MYNPLELFSSFCVIDSNVQGFINDGLPYLHGPTNKYNIIKVAQHNL